MNVEIGAEAAQFPEKEYINGIAFAVQGLTPRYNTPLCWHPQLSSKGASILENSTKRPTTYSFYAVLYRSDQVERTDKHKTFFWRT
jgi:hypothetical protein